MLILWFIKELFLIFQVFRNLPLKSIRIFSYIPISEVATKFFHKFHKSIIKIFQNFVVNVSKMFLTFLSKNFFNLSEISQIVIIDTDTIFLQIIDTYQYQIFLIL